MHRWLSFTAIAVVCLLLAVHPAKGDGQPMRGVVDVRNFGADPTGVVDATGAINAAFAAAKPAGKVVVGLGGYFKISGTVNITTHCDFRGSTFRGDSAVNIPVIRIADDAEHLKRLRNLLIYLPKVSKNRFTNRATVDSVTTWPYNDSGVLVEGLSRSIVYVDEIEFVKTGLHLRGPDTSDVHTTGNVTGTDFNQFHLTNINGCQTSIHLDVLPAAGDEPGGWVNENRFYGGVLRMELTDTVDEAPITGVVHIKLTGWANMNGQNTPNHNLFHWIGVEGNLHEYSVWCEGDYNTFEGLRWERYTPFPIDLIYIGQPAGSPAWFGGGNNKFSGLQMWRFTDAADDYAAIELGTVSDENYAWDAKHIGRVDDDGGGWVEMVDTTGP